MSQWLRLWEDMPNDPKWRVIARRSKRPISEVLSVFVHMLTNASSSTHRGLLSGWSDEDVAIAIDAETEHVAAIREAMQGKVLEGEALSGWSKRQPAREDGSAERAKQWRERQKTEKDRDQTNSNDCEREKTQANASERPRGEESREDKKESCTKPARPVRTRNGYSDDFERFWSAYPTDKLMSKQEAAKVWSKLTPEDQSLATAAIPAFVAHCRSDPTYRPLHAVRFLSQRRFDGFASPNGKAPPASIDFGGGFVWSEEIVKKQVDRWRANPSSWPDPLGPPPDKPGCLVPPHLLATAA